MNIYASLPVFNYSSHLCPLLLSINWTIFTASFFISSPDSFMYVILTWSFPELDSFTFLLHIQSLQFSSIASSSWRMSISSFTAISISSLGFLNLSPVSFSKCALNLSFVIVVPPVPLCPLLHSFLRAAYIAPVFPTLLALLYQLYQTILFLPSQTTPQSVPCCSQFFSCLPNYFL